MNVQNVGLANFNFKQKIPYRKCYSLYWLANGSYSKLSSKEKTLLKSSGFGIKDLKTLYEQLSTIDEGPVIDYIGKLPVQLRHDGFQFEIGKHCRLIWHIIFRNIIRHSPVDLEFTGEDISKEGAERAFAKIVEEYKKMKKNPECGTEEEYYNSETLKTLFSPKFKVKPQKTEKGYLTTIINKETGEPENAYINIKEGHHYTQCILSKDLDNKFPIWSSINDKDVCKQLELASFEFPNNSNVIKKQVAPKLGLSGRKYGGIAYRIIQALIEYSLQKDSEIVIHCNGEMVPLYTKVGFRVNTEKDKLLMKDAYEYWRDDMPFLTKVFSYCDSFGIPRREFKAALIKRSRDGITGYGRNETWEILNRILYQKNKHWGIESYIDLELTPETKKEWLERIKSQPILVDKI